MSSPYDDARGVVVIIPPSILPAAGPPATVTEYNCMQVFGLPPKHFRRFARTGKFPTTRQGHLRVALYEDVKRFLTERRACDKLRSTRPAPSDEEILRAAGLRMVK
jgi:hypothetical protein